MKLLCSSLICVFLAIAPVAGARVMGFLSYQQLFDKADLVLIAEPTATGDTKEKIDLPGIAVVHEDNSKTGLPAVGVETKMHVLVVMKGDKLLKQIVLHHYRLAVDSPGVDDPQLVTFDLKSPHPFLLFLVREQDGRYAPLNQTDPAWQTVQKLEAYVE